MTQLTFQLDEPSEAAIKELQEFFGTKSKASAIRSMLKLAMVMVPAAKDRTLIVRDQNKHEDVKIAITG